MLGQGVRLWYNPAAQTGVNGRGDSVLIVNGTLVTQGRGNRIIEHGALRIEGERIVELGPSEEICAKCPGENRIDAYGMLVMPGLVNAHTHCYAAFARGMIVPASRAGESDRVPAGLWQKLDAALDYGDIRYSILVRCVEAIRKGTTTIFDQHTSPRVIRYSLDAVAEATLQAGLRACLSYGVSERHGVTSARRGVQENARFAGRAREHPLLAASMGAHACWSLSDDTLAAAVGGAALSGVGLHVHVAEYASDARECVARYGLREVERLRKRGALGPRTIAAHCVHLSPNEMDLLRRSQAWIVHTPRSDMYATTGLAPVYDLTKRGLPVCLGTGSFPGNMFQEMEAAYLLQRHSAAPPKALSADGVARMALRANAALASRIFGETLGELSVGALADIVLMDYDSPTPLTEANLPWHLVLGMNGAQVDTTIVGGRVLMRHRSLLTIDEEAVTAHARQRARELWEQL